LIAEGMDPELAKMLPSISGGNEMRENSRMSAIRHDAEGGDDSDAGIDHWASEEVEIFDLYPLIDFDGDGIPERRHVQIAGNRIIENEPFNHVPYAIQNSIMMPHTVIGLSRAEITSTTQRVKTVLTRQMLDNTYQVNHPRNIVHDAVNIDDYYAMDLGGAVRLDDESVNPRDAVFPLQIPSIAPQALQVIQYLDQARAQSTGSLLASQGLDADTIAKETATRFEGIKDASQAKVELIGRNFAETGFRELYEGALWMVMHFQDQEMEARIVGRELKFNPSEWKYNHRLVGCVGIGAGEDQRSLSDLQAMYTLLQQLKAQGSPLVDDDKIYAVIERIADDLGFSDASEVVNNPAVPEELLKAQNEQLQLLNQQLQLQIQQAANPLSEAEQIRAQAKLIEAQSKQQTEIAKLQEQIRQFNVKAAQESQKIMNEQERHKDDLAFDITELEQKSSRDLPGGLDER